MSYDLNPCKCGGEPRMTELIANRFKYQVVCQCWKHSPACRTEAIAALEWNKANPIFRPRAAAARRPHRNA